MVICDRQAGWSGPLQSSWIIVREGLALGLEALGCWGQSAAQCPSWWHLWQAVLGDSLCFGHCLSQWPAFLQIRHLPCALSFIQFLSFIEPIFAWNVPLVSLIFLKRYLVFPILLFSPVSLHCSFKIDFLSLLAILWISTFSWICCSLSSLPFTSSFFSCLWSLLRQPFCLLAFLLLWDAFGHCLL